MGSFGIYRAQLKMKNFVSDAKHVRVKIFYCGLMLIVLLIKMSATFVKMILSKHARDLTLSTWDLQVWETGACNIVYMHHSTTFANRKCSYDTTVLLGLFLIKSVFTG